MLLTIPLDLPIDPKSVLTMSNKTLIGTGKISAGKTKRIKGVQ
jgi:hypothetical protein